MNDSDSFFHVKRGRPKKYSDHIKFKSDLIAIDSGLAMSRKYSDLQIIYTSENFNQKLRNMIFRVPTIVKFPNHILQLQLQSYLEEAVKQLMISELELVGFTIVLDRVLNRNCEIPPEELLKLCFFISKNVFESDEEILLLIKSSLKSEFKNFEINFVHLSQGISFTVSEINKRYMEIENQMYSDINYSYYVDDIIRLSPPYQLSGRNSLKNNYKTDKNPFKVIQRHRQFEATKESVSFNSITKGNKDDQQLALDYYNLMPLEDMYFYTCYDITAMDKAIAYSFEAMGDDLPKFHNNDDAEML